MATQRRRKALNFDLSTKKLKEFFGANKYTKGYAQISRFLTANGFDHRQWSGYSSHLPMSYADVFIIVERLVRKCPWLPDCMNRFDVTNVMTETDMYSAIKKMATIEQTVDEDDLIEDEDLGI